MTFVRRIIYPLVLAACLGILGYEVVTNPAARRILDPGSWTEARSQREILQFINDHYLKGDQLHRGDFTRQRLDHILSSVDPYSDYLSKDEFADFEKETSQQYVGIGVQIANFDKGVTITKVFEDSPASEIGLEAGDRIIAVDEIDMRDAPVGRVVSRITGPPGTRVNLELFRPHTREYFTRSVERRSILFASVVDVQMLDARLGYLKIIEFGQRTGREFDQALDRLEGEGMRGLILDLRNNPGGMLNAAVEVAEQFFDRGETIVEVRSYRRKGSDFIKSGTPARERDYPIVVLMNRGSASASEIVAGSLQSKERAILVGERSYGKGSVQSIYSFSNGEGLRMTTARYYLPDGTPIEDGVGLEPDVVVELDARDAYKLRLQDFYGLARDREQFVARFGFEPVDDPQLGRAIELLREVGRG